MTPSRLVNPLVMTLVLSIGSSAGAVPFVRGILDGLKARSTAFVAGRFKSSSVLDDAAAAEALGISYEEWDAQLGRLEAATIPKSEVPRVFEKEASQRLVSRLFSETPMPTPEKLYRFYPNIPDDYFPVMALLGREPYRRFEILQALGLTEAAFKPLNLPRAEAVGDFKGVDDVDRFLTSYVEPKRRVDLALVRLQLFAPSPIVDRLRVTLTDLRGDIVKIDEFATYARHALRVKAEPGVLWNTSAHEEGLIARMLGMAQSAWRALLDTPDASEPVVKTETERETSLSSDSRLSIKPFVFVPQMVAGWGHFHPKLDELANVDSVREGRVAARAGKRLISYFLSLEKLPPESERAPLYPHFKYRGFKDLHEILYKYALNELGLRLHYRNYGSEVDFANVRLYHSTDYAGDYQIRAESREQLVVAYHRVVRALDHLTQFPPTFLAERIEHVLTVIANHIDPYVRVAVPAPEPGPKAVEAALSINYAKAERELEKIVARIDGAFVRHALALEDDWVRYFLKEQIAKGKLIYGGPIETRAYRPKFTLPESKAGEVRSALNVDRIVSWMSNEYDARATGFAKARVELLKAQLVSEITAQCDMFLAPKREKEAKARARAEARKKAELEAEQRREAESYRRAELRGEVQRVHTHVVTVRRQR